MANVYQQPFKNITLVTGADLTAKQYRLVSVDATGKAVLATAGKGSVGTIQTPEDVNIPAQVMVSGITFAVCDGDVAAGAEVEVGADGKAKALTTGTKVGTCLVGGADGKFCSVLLGK